MNKKTIWLSIFIILLAFLPIGFSVKKQQNVYFYLRYSFPTNIANFQYPKKLAKKRFKYFWQDFEKQNSNLSWFEKLDFNIKKDTVFLDLKEKHIIKILFSDLKINDLSIFNMNNYEQYKLFNILKQNKQSEQIKLEVKEFCHEFENQFLFEKGVSKLIQF